MTLGDKIRNRRLELQLLQKEVAVIIGVTEDSITNWESNLCEPEVRYMPAIIKFLGYVPFTTDLTLFSEKLKYYRLLKGLTHQQMGKVLNVDGSTIGSWEIGNHKPHKNKLSHITKNLSVLLSNVKLE